MMFYSVSLLVKEPEAFGMNLDEGIDLHTAANLEDDLDTFEIALIRYDHSKQMDN